MSEPERGAVQRLMRFGDPRRGPGWNPRAPADPGLTVPRTRMLLDLAGSPDRAMTCVLVAGTKGKGSTAAMLASILGAAGTRAGLYTSPHLQSWRERIRVDGVAIPPEAFGRTVADAIGLVPRLRRQRPQLGEPSAFELLTLAALIHFRRARCRVVVLEVGLGGRFDATNAVAPAVSVIASIGHDHQAVLGRTLAAIAREKAGVLRAERAALLARQPRAAHRALRRACRTASADCVTVAPLGRGAPIGLAGDHQRQNAALARAAAAALATHGHVVPPAAARRGLRRVRLPGRFEVVAGDPCVVLDIAHTPESAAALARTLRQRFGRQRVHVVFGCTADRDPRAIARPLRALGARFYAAAAADPRAKPAAAVAAALGRPAARISPDVSHAVSAAYGSARRGEVVCITGSAALVGEARSAIGLPPVERLWPRRQPR